MNYIIPDFSNSLIVNSSDLISDYLEIGIDSLLDNELLKNIPICRTIIGIGSATKNVRERNLIKNLAIFLNELNTGSIDTDKLIEHQKLLESNQKLAEKELGRVLIILEQIIDNSKSSILGKLYKAYINKSITWDLFIEFSEIVCRMYTNDFPVLKMIYFGEFSDTSNRTDLYRIERLNSLGVIGMTPKAIFIGNGASRQDTYIVLNTIGKIFGDIIFQSEG